jgi:glutamate--cysteine ligase
MVPNLTTALTGPINELEQRILESMPAIERWFRLEWMEHTPAFYTSVDLRNAGFKLAPVDTDLFPGAFDSLTTEMLPLAVQAAMAAIEKICPEAKNLLLIPRSAIPEPAYLQNVQRLVQVFTQAGLNVRLGALDASVKSPTPLKLADGTELLLEPLVRHRGRLGLKGFDPCTILLNTALSEGMPRVLEHLHEQYLLPPLHAGWPVRRMSRHFESYEEVAKKFAKLLGMDPWLINPIQARGGELEVATADGLDALRVQVDAVLAKVRRKYKEYGINEKPFVVVKAESAAGSGVLSLRDAKDLDDPACRLPGQAVAATAGAQAAPSTGIRVFVQEGVPSCERIGDAAAEPVVVMIDRYVVGGYYRVEAGHKADGAAQRPRRVPLAFATSTQLPKPGAKTGASAPNRFYMYGVIARLAMLAAAYELEATDPDAERDS